MLNSNGKLTVRTLTAGGALPVKGSIVRILGADEENRDVAYSLLTDNDGITQTVVLPTPDVSYSLNPAPAEAPYSSYNIEISAPGYFSRKIYGVSVFSGVDSVQQIFMIPESAYDPSYPIGSINAIIPPNERL